jgi:multisubunit Na+/H+ antiporter MnhB subunit
VHWFAFISEPLGLNRTQLEALRRQYLIENLPQESFPGGVILISATTALIVVLGASAWLWPRRRNRISLLAVVTAFGSTSLVSSFLLFFLLTQGFWD